MKYQVMARAALFGWFFLVTSNFGGTPIKLGDYNSQYGCRDWLGGCQQWIAGAGGACSTDCGFDSGKLHDDYVYLFYPDSGGVVKSSGYGSLASCEGAITQWCPSEVTGVAGNCSADCFYEGNTHE
ncbi:MAG TPA: hypothetical protein VKS22_04370 [Candidatus Binataceae bacterium]|nr:hypothetical protein [Candidatus Binataceae bacterium]